MFLERDDADFIDDMKEAMSCERDSYWSKCLESRCKELAIGQMHFSAVLVDNSRRIWNMSPLSAKLVSLVSTKEKKAPQACK